MRNAGTHDRCRCAHRSEGIGASLGDRSCALRRSRLLALELTDLGISGLSCLNRAEGVTEMFHGTGMRRLPNLRFVHLEVQKELEVQPWSRPQFKSSPRNQGRRGVSRHGADPFVVFANKLLTSEAGSASDGEVLMSGVAGKTPVLRLEFETEKLLPVADAMSVSLARLMAATNDVILLQKLVIISRHRADAANEFERSFLNGELGYFVRMLCGHLFEGGIVFRAWDEACRDRINKIIAGDDEAKKAFDFLRGVYGDPSGDSFNKAVLGRIRNLAGFHYKEQTFKEGLEGLKARGELLISGHIGFNRYVLTDEIMTKKVFDIVGGKSRLNASIGKAFELADALAIAVTHLLRGRLDTDKIPTRETLGDITIPPEVLATREEIKKGRG